MKEIILNPSLEMKWDGASLDADVSKFFRAEGYKPLAEINTLITHRNYINYLAKCWGNHFGAVVSPTIFWNMILSNIAFEVNKNPQTYRNYFTSSEDKIEICVQQGGNKIDPSLLIQSVGNYLPEKVLDSAFPRFSTDTEKSVFANYVAFLDMVSPYYNYSMYLCGIPKVKVLGTKSDWLNFMFILGSLTAALKFDTIQNYLIDIANRVGKIIDESCDFGDMFRIEFCGSGHQEEIKGWITEFNIEKPSLAYEQNLVPCISKIDYHNYNDGGDYRLFAGLFKSVVEEGYLVPEFEYIYFKKV